MVEFSANTLGREVKREWNHVQRQMGRDIGRVVSSTVRNTFTLPLAGLASNNEGFAIGYTRGAKVFGTYDGQAAAAEHFGPTPYYGHQPTSYRGGQPRYQPAQHDMRNPGPQRVPAYSRDDYIEHQPTFDTRSYQAEIENENRIDLTVNGQRYRVLNAGIDLSQQNQAIIIGSLTAIAKEQDNTKDLDAVRGALRAGLNPDAIIVKVDSSGQITQQQNLSNFVKSKMNNGFPGGEHPENDALDLINKARTKYEERVDARLAAYAAQQQAESQRGTAHTTYEYQNNAPFTEFAKLAFADTVKDVDGKEMPEAARLAAMEKMLRQVNKDNAEEFYKHLNTYIRENPGEVAGKIGPLLDMQSQATPGTEAANTAQASTLSIGQKLLDISEWGPNGARELQRIVATNPDLKEAANNAAAHYNRRPPLADLQQVEFENSEAGNALKTRYENALAQQKSWDDMARGNPIAGLFMMLLRPLLESMTPDSNPMAILEEAEEAKVHINAPEAVARKLQGAGIETITVRGAAPAAPETPAAPEAAAAEQEATLDGNEKVIAPDNVATELEIKKFEEAINTVLTTPLQTLEANGTITKDEMNIIRSLTNDQLAKLSDDAKKAVEAIKADGALTEIKHGATVDFDSMTNIPHLIQRVAQESGRS